MCLFFRESGVSASFSEMLLLMAIHFHANQMQAIVDLVCTTLGMKVETFDCYFFTLYLFSAIKSYVIHIASEFVIF